MKKILFVLLSILPLLLVANLHIDLDITDPSQHNLETHEISGEPAIPYLPVKILLPMGEEVESWDLISSKDENQKSIQTIPHVQGYYRLSNLAQNPVAAKESIYGKDAFFPNYDAKYLGVQSKNGYRMAIFNIYPYKYNPVSKKLTWPSSLELNLSTNASKADKKIQNSLLLEDQTTIKEIENLVLNPKEISTYHKTRTSQRSILPEESDPYEMVIITDEEREPYFADFINWKNDQGIETGLFLTSDILPNYEGEDNQAKIRNFIIDAYSTYSNTEMPLEFVILGGDDEIVPVRKVYAEIDSTFDYGYYYHEVEENMPCDLYYGTLDGNWNANENALYGEPDDEPDLIPEVSVGRISCETEEEFTNFFNKNYYYTDNDTYSNKFVYMVGEDMDWVPQTWGGDYMDELIPYIPNDYTIKTLYDKDGTNSPAAIKNMLNSGVGFVNHLGHANESFDLGINTGNVDNLFNTEFGLIYSQGCTAAAFEEATSGAAECIGEHFIFNESGAFAFIGNTRFGWGQYGSTNGGSQRYHKPFLTALFDLNMREIGDALSYSREVTVNSALNIQVLRWIHYELTLLGDPSARLKTPNVNLPFLEPVKVLCQDQQGDDDGNLNPGETVDVYVELSNLEGWANAEGIVGQISAFTEGLEVVVNEANYPNITAGSSQNNLTPFQVRIPEDCEYGDYEFRIALTTDEPEERFLQTYSFILNVNLNQANWPWTSDVGIKATPIIADTNRDGNLELLAINSRGKLTALNSVTDTLFIAHEESNENIMKSAAYADIDGDGEEDIVYTSFNGKVFAKRLDGSEIFSRDGLLMQKLTPVCADVNGDGSLEVIFMGINRKLYCVDSEGNELAGFPITLEGFSNEDLASADLNDDGKAEIIVGTNDGKLHAINWEADEIAGFPILLSAPVRTAPIVLDNGNIVVGTNDNRVYMISHTGTIVSETELEDNVSVSCIAADFDNDDQLEIALATFNGFVYILEQNGDILPGFPVQANNTFINPPLAADLDGDDFVDLALFAANCDYYAFDSSGNALANTPVAISLSGNTPAALADIDNDGDFEISSGYSTGVIMIDSKTPRGEKAPWSMYRGNLARTGAYTDNTLDQPFPIYDISLGQSFPNPYDPNLPNRFGGACINYTLKKDGQVKLKLYNIKGQRVKTLEDRFLEKGNHTTIWNGRDKQGKKVSSGVYFYALEANGKTKVKKMIVIK